MTSIAPVIPAEEFETRREAARRGCRAGGLDGLLVCSRGGGAVDRFADVMYLSNHCTSFPFTPDLDTPDGWNGRAHSFVVLPAEGRATLVVDVPDDGSIRFGDGEVVVTDFVIDAVIAALSAAGLSGARLGLVGEDVIPVSFMRKIAGALPRLTLQPADGILAELRKVKSPAEIEALRAASRLGSRMLDRMMDAVAPGVTHGEVLAEGMRTLLPAGGILYNSFMASGHGGETPKKVKVNFPSWSSPEKMETGDHFRAGISGMLGGYVFDLSRSCPVGAASKAQVEMFEAAISCVDAAVDAARPGACAADVATAGLGRQRAMGFPIDGVFSGMGHGIGLGWDVPWLTDTDRTPIVPGMVLCFERTVTRDGLLGDFEETGLVTETGVELITDARRRRW